jgi:hypothetical protein
MNMNNQSKLASGKLLWWLTIFFILQVAVCFLVIDGNTLSFDEAIWHYIGRNWFRFGLTPYTGGVDNKSPLMFIIYGVSDLLFGINYWFPRIAGAASQTIGIFFLYKIAEKKFGHEVGLIAISIYGLSLLWKATGGKYISFSESFEIPLLIAAFYFFLRNDHKKSSFVSGFLAGFAIFFRLTGFFGATAIFISSLKRGFKSSLLFITGLACSVAIFLMVMKLAGVSIREIFVYGFTDNFTSGSVTDHSLLWKLDILLNSFFLSELVLFLPGLVAYVFIKRRLDIFLLWFILAFISINVIGLYARQHFREILPPLCIMSAVSISYLLRNPSVKLLPLLVAIWICFVPKQIEPWLALKNDFVPSTKEKIFCKGFVERTADEDKKALGNWIKQNTNKDDKVFIAGMSAIAQIYSERMSPTIYFNSTQTPRAKKRLMDDLNNNPPQLILIPLTADYDRFDNDLREFISSVKNRGYENEGCKYNYQVFRRR